ncbi:MAG: energy transducer TonB [Alphaproteobacteria bacterium]|nr:energy transducer TonB [Alphaproteobacteria bacterium]
MSETLTSLVPRLGEEIAGTYKEPLTPTMKRAVLAFVIFFHVGGGWALTQIEPAKLVVGDIAPMEVRMVAAEQAAPAVPELPPDEPPPLPEFKPPPELATVVEPPPPDLPPPVFPVEAPPPPQPPKPSEPKKVEQPTPKPPPPKPVQKAAPHPPTEAQPQQQQQAAAAPSGPPAPSGPKTVSASQIAYLVPPNPIYPQHARRAGEEGKVMVRVLIDVAGRPAQVSLQSTSGHRELDESALSAVRAAQFRPYAEGGAPQSVWVLIPINFVLQ